MASSSWSKAPNKPARIRTALFVPGSNVRALEKARHLDVDAVVLDLEDAVGPQEKLAARDAAAQALPGRTRLTVVRINALTSAHGVDDIKAVRGADAILLPKVESPADLAAARMLAGGTPLWAMIETPRAVLALPQIAPEAAALVLGANDLLKEMGARHVAGRANLHYAMAALVTAARAHGALALDAVYNDIADTDGFAAACAMARDFGFDGKSLIHPAQVEPARLAFAPSAAEIADARALLAEFEKPENRDKGVIAFAGRMVERLHADMARRLLDRRAMTVRHSYNTGLHDGAIQPDAAQEKAIRKLDALALALRQKPGFFSFLRPPQAARGLYIWGDVGRGKTMLMDMFFEDVCEPKKLRIHFNAFMTDMHARIHTLRGQPGIDDPIAPVAKAIAKDVRLLCFDEFQVTDVADAMLLGRLFEQFFADGMVIVATSNTPPERLYEGGLNRQLFLPFIDEIKARLDVVELNGPTDYRLQRISQVDLYLTPLGAEADKAMAGAWQFLTHGADPRATSLTVLGRTIPVPRAFGHVARFEFFELCGQPLGVADYLEIARRFDTVLIDHVPVMDADRRNEARRFTLLIDTLYDEGVKLVCSAAAAPDGLYPAGNGADAFRRTPRALSKCSRKLIWRVDTARMPVFSLILTLSLSKGEATAPEVRT